MGRTVPMALASLVGMNAIYHQGDCMKIAILISRFLLGMGFIIFGLNILHPFMTSPPPPEGSLAAQFVAVLVPGHWIALVGCFAVTGWTPVVNRSAPLVPRCPCTHFLLLLTFP